MKKHLIAASILAIITSSVFAQQGGKEDGSQQHSDAAGSKGSIEMAYGTWFMQSAGTHGSERVKKCIEIIGQFYGLKVPNSNAWGIPGLSSNSDTFREASVCIYALNEIAEAGPIKRKGLFPNPDSVQSKALLERAFKAEEKSFNLAESVIKEINVDSSNKGMSWWSGRLQFAGAGGLLTMLRDGRVVFDATHVGAKAAKVSIDQSTSDSFSTNKSKSVTSNLGLSELEKRLK